jgi:uncharacterized damage-inducible protein DinB
MRTSPLRHGFDHHVWATLTLIDACAILTPDQLASPVPGIYGGVLDTMRHIVGADASYLHRLTHGRVPRIEEETMDLAQLRAEMDGHEPQWHGVIDADPDPDETIVATYEDGSETHAVVGIRLAQALHHGTDHRSQICTALTTMGFEPPEIDVWDFGVVAGSVHEVEPG